MTMRPVPEYTISRKSPWQGTIMVHTADLIPAGMGLKVRMPDTVTRPVVESLVSVGVSERKAATLVRRAQGRVERGLKIRNLQNRGRHLGWRNRKLVRRPMVARQPAGMGDDEMVGPPLPEELVAEQQLAAVISRGQDVQEKHRALIDKLGGKPNDVATKNAVENAVGELYNDWTQYGVSMKGGAAPFEWNRLNPVDAILIAVRDDLRNTVDLIVAGKAQQALAKQIAALPKLGMPGTMPSIKVDLPWYAWAGGALALAAATKAAHLW